MMSGGGQEKGYEIWNSITSIMCRFRQACKIYSKEMNAENKKLIKLKNLLLDGIRSKCDEIYLNGSENMRVLET